MNCITCSHPRALHLATGCRMNGCRCEMFTDRERDDDDTGTRRVTFEIPDGYVLTVSFVPVTASQGEPADG